MHPSIEHWDLCCRAPKLAVHHCNDQLTTLRKRDPWTGEWRSYANKNPKKIEKSPTISHYWSRIWHFNLFWICYSIRCYIKIMATFQLWLSLATCENNSRNISHEDSTAEPLDLVPGLGWIENSQQMTISTIREHDEINYGVLGYPMVSEKSWNAPF